MTNKIKTYLLTIAAGILFALPVGFTTSSVYAACSSTAQGINAGVNAASGTSAAACDSSGVTTDSLASKAKGIVDIFSIIVGIVAIVMIIYGGFRYITSGGDSGRVGNAKNTLIYAIIGLVIVALAQLIVRFVLAQTASITT